MNTNNLIKKFQSEFISKFSASGFLGENKQELYLKISRTERLIVEKIVWIH